MVDIETSLETGTEAHHAQVILIRKIPITQSAAVMEFGIVRLELIVRVVPCSTQFARVVRILEVLDKGIIAGEVCLEAAEDADVVPFGEPSVVVSGGCGAEVAIATCAGGVSCICAHGGFGGISVVCVKEERRGLGEVNLRRGLN